MDKQDSNNGHYTDFWIDWHDDLVAGEKQDIQFYTGIIKLEHSAVLEMACMIGRVLLALQ